MTEAIRRQFDFSLAGSIAWAILAALVLLLAAVAITAPVMGCQAKPPTNETQAAIVRTQGAIDRASTRIDSALDRNLQLQRGLEQLRRARPEAPK